MKQKQNSWWITCSEFSLHSCFDNKLRGALKLVQISTLYNPRSPVVMRFKRHHWRACKTTFLDSEAGYHLLCYQCFPSNADSSAFQRVTLASEPFRWWIYESFLILAGPRHREITTMRTPFTKNKGGSKKNMVLHVRPIPIRFKTNILHTPVARTLFVNHACDVLRSLI